MKIILNQWPYESHCCTTYTVWRKITLFVLRVGAGPGGARKGAAAIARAAAGVVWLRPAQAHSCAHSGRRPAAEGPHAGIRGRTWSFRKDTPVAITVSMLFWSICFHETYFNCGTFSTERVAHRWRLTQRLLRAVRCGTLRSASVDSQPIRWQAEPWS